VLASASAAPVARAEPPPPRTFVAVMTADQEVPPCAPATEAARGVAVFHVLDQASGLVGYRVVANNLPGTITVAHIHPGAPGQANPPVQPLDLTPGAENGVIGAGTFEDPALLAAIQADPGAFYVNVHSDVCGPGVIRGQLDAPGA
jgi:hypothetical protein